MERTMNWKLSGIWALRLIPAIILLQTLFFKFTAAPESVWIFTQLGAEPWGRILSGIFELLALILLVTPSFSVYGAILGALLMIGAIGSHLTKLGIAVQGDGGLLFGLGVITLVCCVALAFIEREKFTLFK